MNRKVHGLDATTRKIEENRVYRVVDAELQQPNEGLGEPKKCFCKKFEDQIQILNLKIKN
uniref:Uncharacterized protein n=1 Tax=Romanomermis culicivorax TaxID=13658 RepID=A0A915KCV8_ROMCU